MPELEKKTHKHDAYTAVNYSRLEEDCDDPIKITYFDFGGKGEPLRLAAYYAGIPFIDERLTRDEFIRRKESGALPFGQVPLMTCDNDLGGLGYVPQCSAILRYIGRKSRDGKYTNVYPGNEYETAQIDAVLALDDDCFTGLVVHNYKARFGFDFLADEEKYSAELASVRANLANTIFPRHLASLERSINKEGEYLASQEKPSIADFNWMPRLQYIANLDFIDDQFLAPFPKLKAAYKAFFELSRVQRYYMQQGGVVPDSYESEPYDDYQRLELFFEKRLKAMTK